MNELPGMFVAQQKSSWEISLLEHSHWSGRALLANPHLVNAIVAEYHVPFFF